MIVGLRIDLDTYNGTRDGFPALLEELDRGKARGSFFFSVGPDNMGRHLWRLLKPAFLRKMLSSRAASLYGPEILLRGTFWPGPPIAAVLDRNLLERARGEGHEIGLHAWDHRAWQARADRIDAGEAETLLRRGLELLSARAGAAVDCCAAPAWKGTPALLEAEKKLGLRYASDCRGSGCFLPRLGEGSAGVPQVPVNLPTYDEVIGRDGLDDGGYNSFLLDRIEAGPWNVLTVHAEVEGGARRRLFSDFLERSRGAGIDFVPLGELLPPPGSLDLRPLGRGTVPGREGWLAVA